MNLLQQGTVALFKSAITQQPQPLPEGFDPEAAFTQLARHQALPLLSEGAAVCGFPPSRERLLSYCRLLQASEAQQRQISRLFEAFDRAGIEYMPLKGCNMKPLYPKPELRVMGDADVLIRLQQYDRIVPIMESLGFQPGIESDHELPWHHPELFVELHKWVIPSYNKDFYAYFGDGWARAKPLGNGRYGMTPEDESVYLFTHFAKHYRDGGIGCRHAVDLWVWFRSNPGLDEAYIRAELEKLQLAEFYGNIRRLLAVWFEDAPGDEMTDYITDFIFDSGSWGRLETRTASVAVRDSDHGKKNLQVRLLYILHTLFPSAKDLESKYTVLKKAPWLLPLVWIYRPFYKLFAEPRSLAVHKRNWSALQDENLTARQKELRYVGLDYRFEPEKE